TEKRMKRNANRPITRVKSVAMPSGDENVAASCLAAGSELLASERSMAAFICSRMVRAKSGRVIAVRKRTRKTAKATTPVRSPRRAAVEELMELCVRLRYVETLIAPAANVQMKNSRLRGTESSP